MQVEEITMRKEEKEVKMAQMKLSIEEDQRNLFDKLCDTKYLKTGFKAVKKNRGAAGIDGITIKEYERELRKELEELSEELKTWKYKCQPVKRVTIAKPGKNAGVRLLGIPCVKDRVVQATLQQILEPILDPKFSGNSYGFRPERGQEEAVEAARKIVNSGKEYVVDIDISKFFDRVNHDRLISRLSQSIEDKRILRIIGETLRSGVMVEGEVKETKEGTVQGSPLSPLLSNVVLDELDKELEKRKLEFCRFADDCNIFVRSMKAANRVMKSVTKYLEEKLKLVVNQEKSKVGLSKERKFLGMTIIKGMTVISKQSMKKAMAKVKELTPRGAREGIEKTVKKINEWYMGWSGYYRMTQYPSQLRNIEAHIRRRLRSRIIGEQKRKRHLYNKLCKRGISKKQSYNTVYSNKKRWALSKTLALSKAYSNKWFAYNLGLKSRVEEYHSHWRPIDEWIKIT